MELEKAKNQIKNFLQENNRHIEYVSFDEKNNTLVILDDSTVTVRETENGIKLKV